jgi:osmotically-inducible protein OsmY
LSVYTFWKRAKAGDLVSQIRAVVGVTNRIAVVPTQKYSAERLAEKVIAAIERDGSVDINDINVTVENGYVTLTGTVPTWTAKTAAFSAARYTLGVKDVDNQIGLTLV